MSKRGESWCIVAMALLGSMGSALGCQMGSVCNAPGATSDGIVNAERSEALRREIAQSDAGVPHLGCSAHAVIATSVLLLSDRHHDAPTLDKKTSNQPDAIPLDTRVAHTKSDLSTQQIEYRVLGVG